MAEERKPKTGRRKASDINLDNLGLEMGNKPPQALDVEEAVLGALLIEPNCADEAMGELAPNCFYSKKNRMIFEAMVALVNEHVTIDIISVSQKLKFQENYDAVGGAAVLTQLSMRVASAANIEYNIKVLKEKCIQRELITASYKVIQNAYKESVNVDDLMDMAQTDLFNAIQSNVKRDAQLIGSAINEAMEALQNAQEHPGLSGVPSGFASLDKITQGWQPSDLIILAARPSVGKTAFVLNVARNAAVQFHIPVAFFSLEMPTIQLAKRLMTSESRIDAAKIKGGVRLEPYEWTQLETQLAELAKAPLYIDDTPSLPVNEFRSKVKRLVKQKEVKLVIVDYLQLMQGPAELRGMREQEVAAISRALKATAKEMQIPIIALSQLSRQSEMRDGSRRRPQLSDLRESGSIEQDADMVLFIHRLDYQGMAASAEEVGATQLIIAKHRNGEVCDIPLRFHHEEVRFVDESDSTYNIADSIGSAMNREAVPGGFPPQTPSGGFPGSGMSGGFDGGNEFADTGF